MHPIQSNPMRFNAMLHRKSDTRENLNLDYLYEVTKVDILSQKYMKDKVRMVRSAFLQHTTH